MIEFFNVLLTEIVFIENFMALYVIMELMGCLALQHLGGAMMIGCCKYSEYPVSKCLCLDE